MGVPSQPSQPLQPSLQPSPRLPMRGGAVNPDILNKWSDKEMKFYKDLPVPDDLDDIVEIVTKVGNSIPSRPDKTKVLTKFNELLPQMVLELIEKLPADTRTELNEMRSNGHGDATDWWFAIPSSDYSSLPTTFLSVFCQLSLKTDYLEKVIGDFDEDHWSIIAYETYMEPYYSKSSVFMDFYLINLETHPEEWYQRSSLWLPEIFKQTSPREMIQSLRNKTKEKPIESWSPRLQKVVPVLDAWLTFQHWEKYVTESFDVEQMQKHGLFRDPYKFLGNMFASTKQRDWEVSILKLINNFSISFPDPGAILAKVKTRNYRMISKVEHPQILALDPELFSITEAVASKDDISMLATTKRTDILNILKPYLQEKHSVPESLVHTMYNAGNQDNLEFFMTLNGNLATNMMSTLVKIQPRNYTYLENLIRKYGYLFNNDKVYDEDDNLFYLHAKYGFAYDFTVGVKNESITLDIYSDILIGMDWVNNHVRLADRQVLHEYTQDQTIYNHVLMEVDTRSRGREQKRPGLQLIDNLFAEAPRTTKPLYLWRGVTVSIGHLDLKLPILTSTTYRYSIAQHFASPKGTVLRVLLPPGTPIIPLDTISHYEGKEREILLPRNSMFKLVNKGDEFVDIVFVGTFFQVLTLTPLRAKRKRKTIDEQVANVIKHCDFSVDHVLVEFQNINVTLSDTVELIVEREKALINCIFKAKVNGHIDDEEEIIKRVATIYRDRVVDAFSQVVEDRIPLNPLLIQTKDLILEYIKTNHIQSPINIYAGEIKHKEARLY